MLVWIGCIFRFVGFFGVLVLFKRFFFKVMFFGV